MKNTKEISNRDISNIEQMPLQIGIDVFVTLLHNTKSVSK